MSDREGRIAKAMIRDEDLLDGLEEAEKEHGSMAEALRNAVSSTYAGDDESDDGKDDVDVPEKALTGYQELVEWAGVGERLAVETAMSILANKLNIPKRGVKLRVIMPLVNENLLWKDWAYDGVWLVIGNRDGTPIGTPVETNTPATETVTDGGEARDRLDELSDAGVER